MFGDPDDENFRTKAEGRHFGAVSSGRKSSQSRLVGSQQSESALHAGFGKKDQTGPMTEK